MRNKKCPFCGANAIDPVFHSCEEIVENKQISKYKTMRKERLSGVKNILRNSILMNLVKKTVISKTYKKLFRCRK